MRSRLGRISGRQYRDLLRVRLWLHVRRVSEWKVGRAGYDKGKNRTSASGTGVGCVVFDFILYCTRSALAFVLASLPPDMRREITYCNNMAAMYAACEIGRLCALLIYLCRLRAH